MRALESSNPVLSGRILRDIQLGNGAMTLNGVVNKSLILGFLLTASAYTISSFDVAKSANYQGLFFTCTLISLGLGIATTFRPDWSVITAPLYAIFEGAGLSFLTSLTESYYPGIAANAFLATASTLFAMLILWKMGWIEVTEKFRSGIAMVMTGILVMYLVGLVGNAFGYQIRFLFDNSPLSIGISLFIIAIASLSLLLDFDLIENLTKRNAPAYMEWYSGFALMVTLIWLYVEFLKVLMKLSDRRNSA